MAKKGATSINIKVVATAGSGGGGKSQQHDLRALGLGRVEVIEEKKKKPNNSDATTESLQNENIQSGSHHILEDLMKKHYKGFDMEKLSPEQRQELNKKFMADVNAELQKRGLIDKPKEESVNDPELKRVMSHIDPALTPKNDFLILHPLEDYLENTLKPLVKEKSGQKLQDKCTPYKEGVVVIKPDTTIEDLLQFGKRVETELGWHPMQIYIHHDEGHTNKQSMEWQENYHAHIIFDTINHDTGKTKQLNRLDLANMQTMLAETLKMERGENRSDLAHLNSLEFKQEMEKANMRLDLSQSCISINKDPNKDPRKMMADTIIQTIDTKLMSSSFKPNDRTTLTLLREVGKDLNTNPTARCADAIFATLQQQIKDKPEKAEEIAKIIGSATKIGKTVKDSTLLMEDIKKNLDETATFSGKTESAKIFRPLLNAAKALDIDLIPVMLEPIRKTIPNILSQPIDRDNNNMLWMATERCKVNPMVMLQQARNEGVEELKNTIAEQQEMLNTVTKRVEQTRTKHMEEANKLMAARIENAELADKKTLMEGDIAQLHEDEKKMKDRISTVKSEVEILKAPEIEEKWTDKLRNIFNSDPNYVSNKDKVKAYPILIQEVQNQQKEIDRLSLDNLSDDRREIADAAFVKRSQFYEKQIEDISKTITDITGQRNYSFDAYNTIKEGIQLLNNQIAEEQKQKEVLKRKIESLSNELSTWKKLFPSLQTVYDKLKDMGAKTVQILTVFVGRKAEDGSVIHATKLDNGQKLQSHGVNYTCNGTEVLSLSKSNEPKALINNFDAEIFIRNKGDMALKDYSQSQDQDNKKNLGLKR